MQAVAMSQEEQQRIADAILVQLGGAGRLSAMMGAEHLSYNAEGDLNFRFKLCPKANHLRIHLNGLDLYDLTFTKIRGVDVKTVETITNIYAEDLKPVIEQSTGLCLSL